MKTEAKVGLVTVAAILILLLFISFLRGGILRERGYLVRVIFPTVAGLQIGSSVQMSGVTIGRVQRIELTPEYRAAVTLLIEPHVRIPRGSKFTIASVGLLGDRIVTVSPGPAFAEPLPPNSEVTGEAPFTLEDLYTRVDAISREVQGLISSIREVVGDRELQEGLKQIVRNVDHATRRLERILTEDVGGTAASLRAMANDLAVAAHQVRAIVQAIAGDGELARQVRSTVASLERTSRRVEEMAESLHGLINDEEVKAVKDLIKEARQAVRQANQWLTRMERSPFPIPGISQAPTYRAELELWYGGGRLRSDLDLLVLPEAERFYRMGIRDVGGENLFHMQIGQRLNSHLVGRYGIVDSQIGIGMDYILDPLTTLGFDLANPNALRLNLYGRYRIAENLSLTLRVDNLLRQSVIGFGLRRQF
ncbi:MAG: MlaD family protein [Armatimonadota bacterium]|nr:MlaD family protein [Armatimonadota bacterium]MDR5703822.1 MlaD family protein [Armatimonadota bacterium]